jgi:hypothetical protein
MCVGKYFWREDSWSITFVYVQEKSFPNVMCEKAFSNHSNLKSHLHTHTGKKPFKCDVCGRVFSNNGSQKHHTHTYTGEKPFKCEVCCKLFSLSGIWSIIFIHIWVKNFSNAMQHRTVILYRPFQKTHRSHIHGSSSTQMIHSSTNVSPYLSNPKSFVVGTDTFSSFMSLTLNLKWNWMHSQFVHYWEISESNKQRLLSYQVLTLSLLPSSWFPQNN